MLNRLYGVLLLTLLILALVSSCEKNNAQAVKTTAPTQTVAAETTTLPNTI
ncbi:hypothetical protein [Pontibacter indicus]|uniref:Uncharacterized protein n=1 Tax=Pontibacter indicus TaxID=1317125 RepID=A0A1R3XRI4_9BACT|nr:hypothetical protein [Pontibacter indicus]SIT94516.1 hypothetical protein SAMN05444128_3616 [Pontibacter indicus]